MYTCVYDFMYMFEEEEKEEEEEEGYNRSVKPQSVEEEEDYNLDGLKKKKREVTMTKGTDFGFSSRELRK